jgi:hypothetical protein
MAAGQGSVRTTATGLESTVRSASVWAFGGGGVSGVWRVGLAVVVVLVLGLVSVSGAQAAKGVAFYFGNEAGFGSADGEFDAPRGVAVNTTGAGGVGAGDVYVADAGNHRVQRFDAAGVFEATFGSEGSDAGQFSSPTGVAVDQADGSVYVFDQGNRRVAKYSATGDFLLAFGAGVADGSTDALQTCAATCFAGLDSSVEGGFGASGAAPNLAVAPAGAPNAGHVFVADPGSGAAPRVQEFDVAGAGGPAVFVDAVGEAGSGDGQFGSDGPSRVAVDDAGRVYAVDPGNARIQRFTPALAFDSVFAAAALADGPAASDIAIDPGPTSAGDATDDRVFVVKPCDEAICPDTHVYFERRVKELDTTGTLLDTHGAHAGIASVNGIAVNVATDRIYLSSSTHSFPVREAGRVWVLDEIDPPSATIGPITAVTARGATFSGSVNPGGGPTGYHFEYSSNGTDWHSFPPDDVKVGNGTSDVPAAATVAGVLRPNTLYQVRLVAKHTYGAETDTSTVAVFTTQPAPPTVGTVTNADATDTTATLTGLVNPNNQATTYRFEYGTTTAYGNQTPPASAGNQNNTVTVAQTITGLAPNTTYHYRLTATNQTGTTQGTDHTFTTSQTPTTSCPNDTYRTGIAAHLPNCRAYERVSPADKGDTDVVDSFFGIAPTSGGPTAENGNAVAFRSSGALAGTQYGGSQGLPYLSRRDTDSWDTLPMLPRPINPAGLLSNDVWAFSPNAETAIVTSNAPLTDHPRNQNNIYHRDNSNGGLSLLASFDGNAGLPAVSRELMQLAFDAGNIFTPLSGDPAEPDPAVRRVYSVSGGHIELASRRPEDNTPFQVDTFLGSGFGIVSTAGAVSDDGRHLFFTTTLSDDRMIYRRTDGASTELVSPSKRTSEDPRGVRGKIFNIASSDGRRVFFTSIEQLTNDANSSDPQTSFYGDLYRYDAEADQLLDLSAGTHGLTPGEVQGVIGIDRGGDRVYFVALGKVVPGKGTEGEPNLYLWEDDGTPQGSVRFIATMAAADHSSWSWRADIPRTAQVTLDGTHAVFESVANMTGDNPSGLSQVYLYDAAANNGMGKLTCVSCQPGQAHTGAAHVPTGLRNSGLFGGPPRFLSNDGRQLLFSSESPLSRRDGNGKYDAYIWQDGAVSLISSGRSSEGSYAYGLSVSGDDAFFRTREALVPADGDSLIDIYTARVGGGLAGQLEQPRADCSGEECQGAPQPPPSAFAPPSVGGSGAGNVRELRSCARFTRAARRLSRQAAGLRRRARRVDSRPRSVKLRRRAVRVSKRARVSRVKATRCVRRNRGL